MAVRLNKPPIQEAWIGFTFQPNAKKREWDLEATRLFLANYSASLQQLQIVQTHEMQVRKVSPDALPKVVGERTRVQAVRAFSNDETRWLQLADDVMVYNLLMPGTAYPGFDLHLREAMEKFGEYVSHFQPSRLEHASVHYVDLIEIPFTNGTPVSLSEWFTVGQDLPEKPFGITVNLANQFAAEAPDGDGTLELRLTFLPTAGGPYLRFQLDWHRTCARLHPLDPEGIRARLDAAHDHLFECFRACVTKKTWELFEPLE